MDVELGRVGCGAELREEMEIVSDSLACADAACVAPVCG